MARGSDRKPSSAPVSQVSSSWQQGRMATFARASMARSSTTSERAPQACTETTRSPGHRSTAARFSTRRSTRPASRGHCETSAVVSRRALGTGFASTARAISLESSSRSRRWDTRACPAASSTTRWPRILRLTRRATSHDSNSSLRGRHSASHTARPIRCNRAGPGNRPRSWCVSSERLRRDQVTGPAWCRLSQAVEDQERP